MDDNVDVMDLTLITKIVKDDVEVWIEDRNGEVFPAYDYDFELEKNRVILKI